MGNRLNGKVAVITGASSGIGAATAHRFVEEGCRAVLGDIQAEQGQQLAATLGRAAVFTVCNVTHANDVSKQGDRAVSTVGTLYIIFNNNVIV